MPRTITRVTLKDEPNQEPLVTGTYISHDAVSGEAVVQPSKDANIGKGKIVVLKQADNTWFPLVRQASAIIVEEGTMANHFSQMLREMDMPSVICAVDAAQKILNGQGITIYPNPQNHGTFPQGCVVEGIMPLEERVEQLPDYPQTKTGVYSICSFKGGISNLRNSPMAGIGLMRADFLNNYLFGIHPVAMADYASGNLRDRDTKLKLDKLFGETFGADYSRARAVYVDEVAKHIHEVAQLIPGKRINYRLFDLKSDEACNLIGGRGYEPYETNPMLGIRGTTKLISGEYRPGLELECEIIRTAAERYGVDLHLIIPFCRKSRDGAAAVSLIRTQGVVKEEIGVMIEIPVNAIMADRFANVFDFLVFGPMDMTQSLYMADRGCTSSAQYCDVSNEATKETVNVMLRRLQGYSKDIFIITYEVFSGLDEYHKYQGNNRLHLISFPDTFEKDLHRLKQLEERVGL